MKADPTAQAALLDLQAQDSVLAQLQHRKNSLPEHAQIEELQAKASELDGTRIEADTEVSDLTRDQRKADAEVEQVKTRRTRDEERLNSGAISNPKDSPACSTSSSPSSAASRPSRTTSSRSWRSSRRRRSG